MIFYELKILSMPTIEIASNVDWRVYSGYFDGVTNLMELNYWQKGKIIFEHTDGRREIAEQGMLVPIFADMTSKSSGYMGDQQKHICIAVTVKYDYFRWDSKDADLEDIRNRVCHLGHVLIPYLYPMGEQAEALTERMQRLIYLNSSLKPGDKTLAISEWFSITSFLTNFVLKELGDSSANISPAAERYVKNAEIYILNNYTQKIQVEDIAQHLRISPGHLHRVFKEGKGISVLEYINRLRIDMLIMLMEMRDISLKDASFNVGFDDPAYASRLFKKIKGISYRQYMNVKKDEH